MLFQLIDKEWHQYLFADEKLMSTIERERLALEQYANSDNPNPKYIAKMNAVWQTVANYMASVEDLFQAIEAGRQILGVSHQYQRNEFRLQELEEENKKLKLYLTSLGKDPDLVRYMRISDFR